ncbi:MAG: Na(+)-translocating NADH-quinone reductase subunit A [Calditrichaceae bacterium]|nr:Na(+)-translocating NADH-quinone reductase subunit A [Calditrichaceae bacterium]MBN2710001.1 Na(+)-translocating NADH-quinone reductase subunit A [Calditrichaceae bacterium]RQV97338.1 MAG: Na(+)-translocating NADH-quinone reductase subunit A [Calditrichota bacterium]
MAEFKLKRGYNLKIAGRSEKHLSETGIPELVAVQPVEFPGIKPRLAVQVGDEVKIGSALFADKIYADIKIVSPVSGKIVQINRGERRVLTEIVVENNKKDDKEVTEPWNLNDIESKSREDIIAHLQKHGMWPLIKQRPFSKVAKPDILPRDIFIAGMDTSPLAADPNFLLQGEEENFQIGVNVLKKLTDGQVYLSYEGKNSQTAAAFQKAEGVQKNTFRGPHPAGNIGVQIHHIKPIRHGEIVWCLTSYAVALIGKFIKAGYFQRERIVATAGSVLKTRQYYKTIIGAPLSMLIQPDQVKDTFVRFLSGNVLTGRQISSTGYVSYYDNLITVIPEGKKQRRLLGYFMPGLNTPSFSKTYMSSLIPKKEYEMDTLIHGGLRAFVQSGDYERVLPMNILPVYLIKSIMTDDVEEMEKLGILELDEEDLALCSYICLSKTDFGSILRRGLNLIEKEG